jgi:hypothetical protein
MRISSVLEEINIWRAPEAVLEQTFHFIKRIPPKPLRPKWLSLPAS